MDLTYRWGMLWFIVSEVALFGVFFGALFYTRMFTVPELGGQPSELLKSLLMSGSVYTHKLLWPNFGALWPALKNPNNTLFDGRKR